MSQREADLQALADRIRAAAMSDAGFVRRLLEGNRGRVMDRDGGRRAWRPGYAVPDAQGGGGTSLESPFPRPFGRATGGGGDIPMMPASGAGAFTTGHGAHYPVAGFSSGGGIHIKPSHEGRLTELKARTGKSEAELYADGNPAHRKMVVFARNARKWNHAEGGSLPEGEKGDAIGSADSSPADFVRRLKAPGGSFLLDPDGTVSTHKMSWADADGRAVVFPQVQNNNGLLADFSRTPYAPDAGPNTAVERRDTVMMSPAQADWLTQNYKGYYPGFGKYALGGNLSLDGDPVDSQQGSHMVSAPDRWVSPYAGDHMFGSTGVPSFLRNGLNNVALARLNMENALAGNPQQAAAEKNAAEVMQATQEAVKELMQRYGVQVYDRDVLAVRPDGMNDASVRRDATAVSAVPAQAVLREAPSVESYPEARVVESKILTGDSNKAVREELASLRSGEELKDFQRKLYDMGYYDKDIPLRMPRIRNGSEDAFLLQRRLKDAGYDIGMTGANKDGIDGIIGPKTGAAYKQWARANKDDVLREWVADGIFGPATKKAAESYFKDVANGKSRNAIGFDYSEKKVPNESVKIVEPFVETKEVKHWDNPQCAAFVTDWVRKKAFLGGSAKGNEFVAKNNFRGNAWTWLRNAEKEVKSGNPNVSVPYNMYADGFTGNESKQEVIDRTRKIAKTPEYSSIIKSCIKPGSVVTLLYPRSNKFGTAAEAFREGDGDTMSTHMGIVVEKDGKLYILDNVHGNVHNRRLSSVISGKEQDGVLITGVVNYNYGGGRGYTDLTEFGYEPDYSNVNTPVNTQNSNAYRELAAVRANKTKLKDVLGLSDSELRRYQDMMLGLSLQESFNGTSELYKATAGIVGPSGYLSKMMNGDSTKANLHYAGAAAVAPFKNAAENMSEVYQSVRERFDKDPEDALLLSESKGLTNIKPRGDRGDGKALLSKDDLQKLGIIGKMNDKDFMESPEVSAVMTIYALKRIDDRITDILAKLPKKEYEKIKGDKRLRDSLLLQAWNQGTRKISETVDLIADGKRDLKALLQFSEPNLRGGDKSEWYNDSVQRYMSYYKKTNTKKS